MTTTQDQTQVPTKPRRGRETALDMVRTLAVVFALVVPMYLFHQGGPGSRKHIRPVDPSAAFALAAQDLGAPVPSSTPAGWVTNVVDTATVEGQVRVGYVLGDHYLEYVAEKGTDFLPDATGQAAQVGTVEVSGAVWQDWRSKTGAESLVRRRGDVTVLVGGVRETATRAELEALAALVR